MPVARRAFTLIELLVVVAIMAVLMGLTVVGVGMARYAALRAERAAWLDQRRLGETGSRRLPVRVLFVGNSYTGTNDLPGTLTALVKASGTKPELVTDERLVGGAKLRRHWDEGVARDKLRDGDFDFVVLQEQSQTPLARFGRDEFFYPAGRDFARAARDAGTIPMFYMTWTRPDTPAVQDEWTYSYINLAKETNAEVCPAGLAWERVKTTMPGTNLYLDNGGHPTPAGTYLVACTFYAHLYDKSPAGLPASVTTAGGVTVGASAAEAAAMQDIAWQAVVECKRRMRK